MDFAAGCIGGAAGVLVGYPLDTVKVKIQTQDLTHGRMYSSTFDCFTKIVRQEGAAGLYRGMSSPLAGIAAINAITFGVYGNVMKYVPDPESIKWTTFAGACAGFVQSFVCSPLELVKCQMQTHGDAKGPVEVIKQIHRQAGFKGLNRGLTLTVMREVPGFAVYFGSYEIMIRKFGESTPMVLFAGGMAGIFSWITTYPQDVLKSRIQADGFGAHQEYRNALHCLKLSLKKEGHQFLFRGIGSTIIRAFPMNAVTFGVYTQIMKRFAPEEADDYDTITSLKWCSQTFNILPHKAQNHWPVKKEYKSRKIMHIATDTPNILAIQQPMANISYSRMYPETILTACPDRTPTIQVSAWERIRESMDSSNQSEGSFSMVDSISMHPSPEMIFMKAPKVENEVQEEEPAPPSLLVESKCLHRITTSDLLIPSNLFASRRSLDKIYGFYYLMS